MQLGTNHIERLIAYYNGSYPLAIAAYNAGPGNVNKWLRDNGDPRTDGRLAALDRGDRLLRDEELRAARGGKCGGLRTPLSGAHWPCWRATPCDGFPALGL